MVRDVIHRATFIIMSLRGVPVSRESNLLYYNELRLLRTARNDSSVRISALLRHYPGQDTGLFVKRAVKCTGLKVYLRAVDKETNYGREGEHTDHWQ